MRVIRNTNTASRVRGFAEVVILVIEEQHSDIMEGIIELSDEDFHLISRLVYERFGINLTEKKKSLVMGRLNKLVKQLGLSNYRDYYDFVTGEKSGEALSSLIDRISTNHSFFFREMDHYNYLVEKVLPEIEQGSVKNDLRIWCAGCAAGEEPYTIAMLLHEYFGSRLSAWEIGILATDISLTALRLAQEGVYPADKIRETPPVYKNKYFKKYDQDAVQVDSRLKSSILFKRLNLMNSDFPFREKFNIIFCRNVMIYFDAPTREGLVNRFHRYLYDGGYLFIGHSESLHRSTTPFRFVQPSVYRKD